MNGLLDRLEELEGDRQGAGATLERTYRQEISRVRNLLSQYYGRPNPSRDMYL